MPKIMYLALWLVSAASGAVAYAACGNLGAGEAPCTTPFQMEKIKTVTIEKSWTATSINRGEEDCNQHPAITPDDVTRFLQEAGRITEHDAVLGDLSSCIASGSLVTESGRHAEWRIGQGGTDSGLIWKDTGEVDYLY